MSTTVANILKSKPEAGRTVYTIGKDESVYDALKLMAIKSVGALVVTEGNDIVGIVTERDYARKVVLLERSSKATRIEEIMTVKVRYVEPSQTSDQCMALMTEHRVRHLPVLEGGKLLGVISIGDLVKSVIADQQYMISQLEHYIHGTPIDSGAE
ncbi:CBS domain-containing protein [Burkholderia plantarii]|uniref:CBS domain-containing protein n=1 Tax=Burkholderia plantarii TaxID=41899 RepID=UPI0018DBA907|nr:CBS domain-containing protein [Burkholderia plantarii]MBI0330023.1 CBS domain-containing protein [Burkholderia plantarii]